MPRTPILAFILMTTSGAALADVPSIVTDIAPVHGLVSMVTGDLASPSLLVEPAASPHTNAMRPSAAAALQDADVVFWVGEDLTPWLVGPIENLASSARTVSLLALDETKTLPFRDADAFGNADGHEHMHNDPEEVHGHNDHDDGHEGHGEHDDGHGHDHSGIDPHAWLSPANAQVWLDHIAATLSKLDPENAETYAANATAGHAEILGATNAAAAKLAPVKDKPFVVFHDAYHYFEDYFEMTSAGALSLSDAVPPSPSQLAAIQARIQHDGIACVFSEPQFSDRLVTTVIGGTDAKSVMLDPLGADLEQGNAFYPALIRNMADRFSECLQ